MMADIFDVKNMVTARQCAERYGIRFGRSGRAFCPFHDDGRHPALSFKDGGFCCFACGAKGDCITFVARLQGVTPLHAAQIINADFGLGLGHAQLDEDARREWAQKRAEAQAARERQREAHDNLDWALLTLNMAMPRNWDDIGQELRMLLQKHAEIEYLADEKEIPEWGWKVVEKIGAIRKIMDGRGRPMLVGYQHGNRNGK